jgi:alpha-L-fucosidase
MPGPWGVATCKGNSVFLHVFRWPETGTWRFPALPGRKVKGTRILSGGEPDFSVKGDVYELNVEKKDLCPIVTTIELVLDGDAPSIEPLAFQKSLTRDAKITASHDKDSVGKLIDRDATTSWHAKGEGSEGIWIETEFSKPVTIGSIVVGRGDAWSPRHSLAFQVPDKDGNWKTVEQLRIRFEPVDFLKKPVTTDKVRLNITGTTKFCFAELELYEVF